MDDIPLNIAKNNPFYHAIFYVFVGPGYKTPTYDDLRGATFQNEKKDYTTRLELKKSWETITDCTVMSNAWMDGKGKFPSFLSQGYNFY